MGTRLAAALRPGLPPGLPVEVAPHRAAGEAAAQALRPTLVVAQTWLPDGTGGDLAAALAQAACTAHIPVIVASASDTVPEWLAAVVRAEAWSGAPARRPARRPARTTPDAAFLGDVFEAALRGLGAADFGARALADAVGLSPRQFRRRLADTSDETPAGLLRRLRLERAAALLADRSRSVKEVAYLTGFASDSGFRSAFRAAYGLSPQQYRGR